MATTEQQLRDQYELEQKRLGLSKQQIEENYRQSQLQAGLSQQQLEESYRLTQQQLLDTEKQTKETASKLAQQAYLSKQQSERVMPNVLNAQGLEKTGYANISKQRSKSAYEGQQSAIQSDLNVDLGSIGRQRTSQDVGYKQGLESLAMQRQNIDLEYQQNLRAIEIENESAALDYRYALQSLQEANSKSATQNYFDSKLTQSQSNAQDISRAIGDAIKAGQLNTNTAAQEIAKYKSYMEENDYIQTVRSAKQLADAVAQQNAAKARTTPTSTKLQKALAIGQW